MNKDEYFESIKNKVSITKEEFNKQYEEAKAEMKERGVPDASIEKFALVLVQNKLKKQLMSPSKKFRGYLIGINPNAALNRNVDKVKEDSILQYRKDEAQAIEYKFVDSSGNPLWHIIEGMNIADWKLGNLITDDDYTETLIMLAKQEEDKSYKLSFLTLKGTKILPEKPKFVELEFVANIRKDEDVYILSQSINTEFKVINEEEIDFPEIAKKCLKNNCIDIKNIEAWHDKNSDNFNRIAVTKGSVINVVPSFDESKSHIINISSSEYDLEQKPITCWVNQKENINFSENTLEIYIIGSTNSRVIEETQETRFSINAYGIFVPKIWRVEKPEEIKQEKIKETEEW